MADKKFTEFAESLTPDTGDYVVGHTKAGDEEIRVPINNLPFGTGGGGGTTQGTSTNNYNIRSTDEGVDDNNAPLVGAARGEHSVDLQTLRQLSSEVAAAPNSVIIGGKNNQINVTAEESFIGGGADNAITGRRSVIAGGSNISVIGHYAASAGGNSVQVSGDYDFVGGGISNVASGGHSSIVGGSSNTSSGKYSAICGGESNASSGYYSTVGGGINNSASSYQSTVGGGVSNTSSGYRSTVGGGYSNLASGGQSTISGGYDNTASGYYSTVSGGQVNTSSGQYSTIGGGLNNTASAYYSTVSGGLNGLADKHGQYTFSGGGQAGFSQGESQLSEFITANITSDATQTELYLDGTSASERMVLNDGETWAFSVRVAARRTDATGESAGYKLEGVIDRFGASTGLVGAVTKTVLGEDNAAWDVTVEADDTNEALVVKVTGEASKTIRWVAQASITIVGQ